MAERVFFTSESVTEGHPDKICDQISDAILDEMLRQDPDSRAGIECLAKTGFIVIAGEVKTKATIDPHKIARGVLRDIGYTDPQFGVDCDDVGVLVSIHEQSPDISIGVTKGEGMHKEQGAGDQGMMFGYATNETKGLMPLPIQLAHKLTMRLSEVRKNGIIPHIGPDGKSQVTVEYRHGKPARVDTIVISQQHKKDIDSGTLRDLIKREVIQYVCGKYLDENTTYHINPTGSFVIGGPEGDAGLTGRKIIVDTYGGMGRHGGGCFSGKDASKVDRSAAYMARYIAKNVVAAGLADTCEVQLSYAIGVAQPTSVLVHCFGTNKIPEEQIESLIRTHFSITPEGIITTLDLKRPIYRKTAVHGHFGREDPDFTWEKTNKADDLKRDAGM